ncbi:MAG: AbrB/MazE/SpoVT family DNA-binding domain-containing protein [Candidatus Dormibacteria bacterium]
MAVRITSKGQVTIPKRIRLALGVRAGDEIEFVETEGVVRVAKVPGDNPFSAWMGHLKHLEGVRTDDLISAMRDE